MKIEYRKGDLLKSDLKYIAHGCNAQGVMGSGIAKQIKLEYPRNYVTYVKAWSNYYENGLPFLGQVIIYEHSRDRIILNCITQEDYGRGFEGKQYASYDAIRKSINHIDRYLQLFTIFDTEKTEVGFPKIGSGLAGGNWEIISKIIEEESFNFQPVVYEL